MELGVNVVHDESGGLVGFDRTAARALRPALVRKTIDAGDIATIPLWIESAELLQLRVLWTVRLEKIFGYRATHAIQRLVASPATAGFELGDQPWRISEPVEFMNYALAALDDIRGFPWAILLGLGCDGSPDSVEWIREFWRQVYFERVREHVLPGCTGVAFAVTAQGIPLRNQWRLAREVRVVRSYGLTPAFTRVGWQIGEPLAWWPRLVENFRAMLERPDGLRWHVRDLAPTIRDRWLLEACDESVRAAVSHFIVEPDRRSRPFNEHVNLWSLYDQTSGRPDRVWNALQWRSRSPQEQPHASVSA